MAEATGLIVLKLPTKEAKQAFKGISNTELTNKSFKTLVEEITGDECQRDIPNDLEYSITGKKLIASYGCMYFFGDEWEHVISALSINKSIEFWAFLNSEYGYDSYEAFAKDSAVSKSVMWEGSSDPEEEQRIARAEFYQVTPKKLIPMFLAYEEELDEDELADLISKYKIEKASFDYVADYHNRFTEKHSLFLELRIKAKGKRKEVFNVLRPYVDYPSESAFQTIKQYFDEKRDLDEGFPSCGSTYPAPVEVAKGLCYVEEGKDTLYVGFNVDNIDKFASTECNYSDGSANMNHVLNMVEHFKSSCDGIRGCVHTSKDHLSIWMNGGYLYLT